MTKLLSYRTHNDPSKYSSFCNDFNRGPGKPLYTSNQKDVSLFAKVNKVPRKSTTKKEIKPKPRICLFKKCIRCCNSKSSDSISESIDGAFSIVQYEMSRGTKTGEEEWSSAANKSSGESGKEGASETWRSDKAGGSGRFVSDIVNCHDAFLQTLEFSCDNTLLKKSRRKRPRPIVLEEIYLALACRDDDSFSECDGTLPRRSNSPVPTSRDHDFDRLVGLHNRSGLQARSESMASVYSGAGDGSRGAVAVRGAAQFALTYNYRLGALDVNVRRCRDLAAVDAKRNRSDPYVKVYLLPDKSKCGKRKTKVKKNTLNPIFDETLRFVAPLSALGGRTLWLGVWHADMFGRNDFLGEVTLPLADLVFDDPTPKWYNLQERTEQLEEPQGSKGELIVGLMWEPGTGGAGTRGTLHVLVKEAKGLCATKPNGLADAFCKSYLLPERGRGTKQKTAVVRRSLSPRWEHSFVYRSLSLSDLKQRALELSVWDRDLLTSNDFMGGVRFSTGSGTYLGAAVDWMDSVGKEVSLWETMMSRPNFWVEGSVPLRPSLSN